MVCLLVMVIGGWQQLNHFKHRMRYTEPFSHAQGDEGRLFRWLPANGFRRFFGTVIGEPLTVALIGLALIPLSGLAGLVLIVSALGMTIRAVLLEQMRYTVYLDRRDGEHISATQRDDSTPEIYEQAGRDKKRSGPRASN